MLSFVDPREDQASVAARHREPTAAASPRCRTAATTPGPARKRLLQLGSLLLPWSYERLIHREAAFQRALDQTLATEPLRHRPLRVLAHGGLPASSATAGAGGPAFLLDEHNIEYDIVRQTARAGGSAAAPRCTAPSTGARCTPRSGCAWTRLDGCTLDLRRATRACCCCTPRRPAPPSCPTASISTSSGRAPGASRREPTTLLFFGAIDYYPNTDGLLFFLRRGAAAALVAGPTGPAVHRRPPAAGRHPRPSGPRAWRSRGRSTTSAPTSSARRRSSSRCASAAARASRSSRRWRWARRWSRRPSAPRGSTSCRSATCSIADDAAGLRRADAAGSSTTPSSRTRIGAVRAARRRVALRLGRVRRAAVGVLRRGPRGARGARDACARASSDPGSPARALRRAGRAARARHPHGALRPLHRRLWRRARRSSAPWSSSPTTASGASTCSSSSPAS